MRTLTFDCRTISCPQDFYQQLVKQQGSEHHFGHNLDALWDWLTGYLPLPICFVFDNLTEAEQWHQLMPIISLLEQASEQTAGQIKLLINRQNDMPINFSR